MAEFLRSQEVRRVYGLCGGHIQPIWDAIDRAGITIVDVRHEASAVYMAHAEAELSGDLAVALVTAGPGLTNAVTAMANAHASRIPVLVISGRAPRPQAGMGAMQELPQAALVSPVCRRAESVSEVHHVLGRLDAAAEAARGAYGTSGPAYIDFPTDLLDEPVEAADIDPRYFRRRPPSIVTASPDELDRACDLIATARRPLVIAGRGSRAAQAPLASFLHTTGALGLDTAEARGAIRADDPAYVPAMRSRVMREADLVVTLGRRLDYQLAYGSSAVFSPDASFLRIGRSPDETSENRPGDAEVRADIANALAGLLVRRPEIPRIDHAWVESVRSANATRVADLAATMATVEAGRDARMHPYRLIAALNDVIDDDTIVVADGGDILSFARVGLKAPTYLDCGALGCLGVGVPFATAAALAWPDRRVIALIGDGSFGFTGMDLDTAARRGAKAIFVVANNEGWNIERNDQLERYGGNLVGVELPGCDYRLVAQGLGLYAERVTDPSDLAGAIDRALARAPALLDVAITRDAVSPDTAAGLAAVPPRHALRSWHDAEMARRGSAPATVVLLRARWHGAGDERQTDDVALSS